MASDFQMNNVFRGDFIVSQTEVIFFKRKKKKKKQPTPKRCILLITHDTVALTDPKKDNKPMLMFPRNTITTFRFNTDDLQYKLELSVWIKDKTHQLCIEFPTNDAKQQRDIFIKHFTIDQAKPIHNNNHIYTQPPPPPHTQTQKIKLENTNNKININTPANTTNLPLKQTQNKPNINKLNNNNNNTSNSQTASASIRRGTKRKHQTMNEETLRKRACKLAKHKYLATLYKTLVGKNILTPNEFWDEYGADIDIKQSSNGLIEGIANNVLKQTINNMTWSLFSEFKDDLEFNEANMNEDDHERDKDKLKVNLTAERILKIFVNLPEVKLAYDKNVPFNFSEKEFWKAFLQSHYFKRGTTRNVTSGISDKETQMDKLLKQYLVELQLNNNNNETSHSHSHSQSPNPNRNIKTINDNSFAKQLRDLQLIKNKEVDVDGALATMRQEIAEARANKDENNQFVNQIENGNINVNVNGNMNGHMNGHSVDVKVNVNANDHDIKIKMENGGKDSMHIKQENGHDKDEMDNDVDMVDKNNTIAHDMNTIANEMNYKRKLNILDRSIDLSLTQDCFTELIEEPSHDENKNMRTDDIQKWFKQVNQHGMMVLYQSINQNNKNSNNNNNIQNSCNHNKKKKKKQNIQQIMANVPKVNYGRKYIMELNGYNENDNEINDNMNDIKMNNEINEEEHELKQNEFKDLIIEDSKPFIELRIKDQSVYWGDNFLLNGDDLTRANQVAKQLDDYLGQVQRKKKKLAELKVVNLIASRFVEKTIVANTERNYAGNEVNRVNNMKEKNKKDVLMIYTQSKGDIKANKRILDQLSTFQKPMKELVRHYWNCFPANQQKLNKAQIIVTQLTEYKLKLVEFQTTLEKKKSTYKIQKILLQELIDLANKVLKHHKMTQNSLHEKKMKRQKLMDAHKQNID